MKTSGKKGFKTIIASSEEALEIVRTKVIMRVERKGLVPPSSHIYKGTSFLLANDCNDPSTT